MNSQEEGRGSSVQDDIYALVEANKYSTSSFQAFSLTLLWNGSNVRPADDAPFSSFQCFLFHASLL